MKGKLLDFDSEGGNDSFEEENSKQYNREERQNNEFRSKTIHVDKDEFITKFLICRCDGTVAD